MSLKPCSSELHQWGWDSLLAMRKQPGSLFSNRKGKPCIHSCSLLSAVLPVMERTNMRILRHEDVCTVLCVHHHPEKPCGCVSVGKAWEGDLSWICVLGLCADVQG